MKTLAAVLVLATPALARAESPPETTPLALRASARAVAGVDGRAGFGLGLASVGGDLHLSPGLTLGGHLVGQVPLGTIDEGEPSAFGFGGELTLRAMLLSDTFIRPYLTWNLGIAFFADRPFLPGGDIYDFMIGGGIGAEVSPTRETELAVEVFMLHESNGQGIGAFNPAFDGFGMAVSMSWSKGMIVPLSAGVDRERRSARSTWTPGASIDGVIGQVGGDVLGTGRMVVAQRLAAPLSVVGDLEYGTFAGAQLAEGGAALVLQLDELITAALHLGYRDYAGLGTTVGVGQLEWHAMPAASLVGMAQFERNEFTGDIWRAGFGLRTYVRDSVMVLVGLGFNDLTAADATFEDISNPFVGFEWRLPIGNAAWQVSVYGERRISTFDVAGLRLAWNMGATPRASARHDAWRRLQ